MSREDDSPSYKKFTPDQLGAQFHRLDDIHEICEALGVSPMERTYLVVYATSKGLPDESISKKETVKKRYDLQLDLDADSTKSIEDTDSRILAIEAAYSLLDGYKSSSSEQANMDEQLKVVGDGLVELLQPRFRAAIQKSQE